ncbi:MAG: hypothetical protein MUP81_00120 [Dehalococcoidia bacterium]|nr:hypothetical protein [Dehalococcoidia bacterium]
MIKKPEAELAIQFQQRRKYNGEGGKTDEEWALDEADRILMKKYKGKLVDVI